MKIILRNVHLYLGLIAGLIITITCFTGAILVFENELELAFHPQRYTVTVQPQRLSLADLIAKVQAKVPGAKLTGIKVYSNASRSVEISYVLKDKLGEEKKEQRKPEEKRGKRKEGEKDNEGGRKTAFVNPYTGDMLDLYSYKETFFYAVFALHRWLLGGAIGKLIVGISTLFFVIILLTGFILWWPKSHKVLKQRLKVKWDGNWKRLNNDLHIVFGFYSAIFLFAFAFTGLAWSFDWFNKGIYKLTASEMVPPKQVNSVLQEKTFVGPDSAILVLKKQVATAQSYQLNFPKDSVGTYTINLLPKNAYEMQNTTYWVDAYEAKIIDSLSFAQKNVGQRVRATFKPIHTASIFGFPSKFIGLLACLLGVVFPTTGFIMWCNRVNGKK
jgi:uncharacterized iron-regulated membrane protein